ncbi:NADPH-dependent 7-cyano-7-deazaguanine reductase QueF [Vibrio ostreicida]|uniref:NADPH-dependent 7-cyano-7-deazaguanine reductase n=1 Tax=Vibrio ostreicida TaxID=526588 RepID=A0ABT8BP58_9VIBR|nr:NADPH-dependent 7-cyano-7-deazaguanine reductase QueF [Vibrio ostreicida]MDN3608224.1 NADPH-dependent 7-cyano-7-deazaguanine reductase QueF [Vibrio ostreicida]NPD09789.1 NADPH-dependent 7-cyano-7-deazaguanine reductase QueF [Vibrio ostreicida]
MTVYDKNLGKSTNYISHYQPELLDPIPRARGRAEIKGYQQATHTGFDLWTAFEISWLNSKGKPVVAIGEFVIPQTSDNLIESKSFKLYLNSFNQTCFESKDVVMTKMKEDLSAAAGADVTVSFTKVDTQQETMVSSSFHCIDELDISVDNFDYDAEALVGSTLDEHVSESLCSHLLKSNCLVTNQPDWGSVYIRYTGAQINHETLLKYLISFREHNEFHEQCVERIYSDIKRCCDPEHLTVFARYTRRGGLDINPFRSDFESELCSGRNPRQ